MDIITQIAGLLLSLSILVIFHEMGHFFFAKMFSTRVEKFYLFFNPWFSLFTWKKGETEYGVGWLPLGGYVKIAGMIDESMDTEQLQQDPQPYEFRSKTTWQRLLIMVGGVLFNFIMAIAIYILIMFIAGREYLPVGNMSYGVVWDSLALENGLRNGDKIVRLGTKNISSDDDFTEITKHIIADNPSSITVDRAGAIVEVQLPANFVQQIIARKAVPLAIPAVPFIIDSILPSMPAAVTGLRKGDRILAIDSISTPFVYDVMAIMQQRKSKNIVLQVQRDDSLCQITASVNDDGKIGIMARGLTDILQTQKVHYTFMQAIPAGFSYGVATLSGYVKSMKLVFTKEGAKSLGGFGAIGGLFPTSWNWLLFWERTAFLSIILAFMNILPIPALDGGHVIFLVYEIITGRKPGDKFMEYAQLAGMFILLALLLYANANDVLRLVNK